MTAQILDAALSGLEKIKLARELSALRENLKDNGAKGLQKIRAAKRIRSIRQSLGVTVKNKIESGVDAGKFFYFDPDRKVGQRKKDNKAAYNLLESIKSGEIDKKSLTEEQKTVLAKYSGTGGGLTGADGKTGSPYEYYTPKPLADSVWALMDGMGFNGGSVLDPSAGTGIFGATSPKNAIVDAVELDESSGMINQILNGDEGRVTISPFESIAASTKDEIYDSVVTNIPFGDNSVRGKNALKDDKYQKESLEGYFILRSLEKLKPNGLACFISSKSTVSSHKMEKIRVAASMMAEFMGAYRLPNKMFSATGADVVTDVIVFKKHSKDARLKIEEMSGVNTDILIESNVLWQPFISGKYFKEDGKKYILGKTELKKDRWGKMAETLVSDASISDISKSMKAFGGSRIKWADIDSAEPEHITYKNGDTISAGGQQMIYKNGSFEPIAKSKKDVEMLDIGASVKGGILDCQNVTHDLLIKFAKNSFDLGRPLPSWLKESYQAYYGSDENIKDSVFLSSFTALSAKEAFNKHAHELPFNYSKAYKTITENLPKAVKMKGKVKGYPHISDALSFSETLYSKKEKAFSPIWIGNGGSKNESQKTSTQKYERIQYGLEERGFIPIDTFINDVGVSPYDSDDWCLSPDGLGVMSSSDYYQGSYSDFLKKYTVEGAFDNVPSETKEKLLRQLSIAENKLIRIDPDKLQLGLSTPYVSPQRKAEFLNKYIDKGFSVERGIDGDEHLVYSQSMAGISSSNEKEEKRNIKRFFDYITTGSLATRTSEKEKKASPKIEKERIERLRNLIKESNQKFDSWAKANPSIKRDLKKRFDNPDNLFFEEEDDISPIDIDGINPEFTPRSHQNSAVRRYTKRMTGILGYDVGLGKTATALLSVQHLQNIGAKKKTIFVVPNATITNWKKEADNIYTSDEDCLYVGMTKKVKKGKGGKPGEVSYTMKSSDYARDMMKIMEGGHSKIFMTLSAFEKIPMRDTTLDDYIDHIQKVDKSFSSDSVGGKTESIKREGKAVRMVNGTATSGKYPYLEDMGIDSLVIDEAHMFKNSKMLIDFKGASKLSTAAPSGRGLDMQVKSWYIRKNNPLGDGIMPLTATPITNSPLEMYSMLSISIGEDELNKRLGGISGGDNFMEAFCNIDEGTITGLDGTERIGRKFVGLKNTAALRSVLHGSTNIKDAKEASLDIPDYDEISDSIDLPEEETASINHLKRMYSIAKKIDKDQIVLLHELAEFNEYSRATGEKAELVAHPFNLINKLEKLVIDADLSNQETVFSVPSGMEEDARKVVESFNKAKIKEKRARVAPRQDKETILSKKIIKKSDGGEAEELTVWVKAVLVGDKVVIDTTDYETQSKFIKMSDKAGIDFDVSISPKMSVLVKNVIKENSAPKAKGGKAKQIIFCDMIGLHHKIKILVSKLAGIPKSKIAIVNGKSISDPADMQDLQDGFNAEAGDNKTQIIIANKKAEVGINLQKGTQAIHHLTIGWTPDSLQQRNGRGVRQGNYVKKINVYHYDANGTFDEHKREFVNGKADWINSLMKGDNNDNIQFKGGLSNADAELLIESMGDPDAVRKIREGIEKREKEERKKQAQESLAANLNEIQAQEKTLLDNKNFNTVRREKILESVEVLNKHLRANDTFKAEERKKGDGVKFDQAKMDRAERTKNAALIQYKSLEKKLESIFGVIMLDSREGSKQKLSEYLLGNKELQARKGSSAIKIPAYILGKMVAGEYLSRVGQYRWTAYIKDEGEIYDDWQMELDTARSMIKEAKNKITALSSSAGVSEDRINAVNNGEAIIHGGMIVGKGDFVLDSGKLYVVKETDPISLFSNIAKNGETTDPRKYAGEETLLVGEVVNKENPKHGELVKKAIEIDREAVLSSGGIKYSAQKSDGVLDLVRINELMSDHTGKSDEVSNNDDMVRITNIRYPIKLNEDVDSIFQWLLPPMNDTKIEEAVIKAQSAIVQWEDLTATVKISDIDRFGGRPEADDWLKLSIKTGLPVSSGDIRHDTVDKRRDVLNEIFKKYLTASPMNYQSLDKIIEKSGDEEPLSSTIFNSVIAHLKPIFDEDLPYFFWGEKSFMVGAYTDELKRHVEKKVYAKQALEKELLAEEKIEEQTKEEFEDDDWVAMTGNLYPIKDEIKALAKRMDSKALWCKVRAAQSKVPNPPANSWIVRYDVYKTFLEENADDVQEYNVSIADKD